MSDDRSYAEGEDYTKVDTKEVTDKKCPACGGTMDFDPATGGLACPFCGHVQAIPVEATAAQTAMELDFETAEQTANCDWGVEKKTVICKSCGAESVYDALQISDECPYCGSNQVMEAQDKNTLAPGGVCVFKIDKKQAGERFTNWLKHKIFCPSAAKKMAKPESFKGVYLPYWTFDTDTSSSYTARYGKNRTVSDGKGNSRTVTDWHSTSGYYNTFIDDQLAMATEQHSTNILSRIEPFRTEDNLAYKPEYVSGFVSERYSIGLRAAWENAKNAIKARLKSEISSKIRTDNHADEVDSLIVNTTFSAIKYKYLLLPVWLSSFKYKNKVFQFMVNGQTGKVGGKAPVSALRVIIAVLIGLAIVATIVMLAQ